MDAARLGVIVLLPEPIAAHVQAWRRALLDPARDLIPPHLTLVPPQTVAEGDLEAARALLDRAAASAQPGMLELRGAATFLPESPVAYLVVAEGDTTLRTLELALRRRPLEQRTYPFHPHVTVAQDRPAEQLQAAVRDLRHFRASFPLPELALMEEDEHAGWRVIHQATIGASEQVREVPMAEAASAAVFLVEGGQVLLGQRSRRPNHRYPGVWDALGGKPEGDEPLLHALVREAREEAGVEPLEAAPIGCFHDGERADAFYLATQWRGEPRNTDREEHLRLEWVPLESVSGLALAPTTRRALARLQDVLGHRR